jgi:hypothetical protein
MARPGCFSVYAACVSDHTFILPPLPYEHNEYISGLHALQSRSRHHHSSGHGRPFPHATGRAPSLHLYSPLKRIIHGMLFITKKYFNHIM